MWLWYQESVGNMSKYPDFEAELDSMKLLSMIKKQVYTGGTRNINKFHNSAMVHMNLMNLHQDRFQDIQDFHNLFIVMKKACSELGLAFRRYKDHAKAVFKDEVDLWQIGRGTSCY